MSLNQNIKTEYSDEVTFETDIYSDNNGNTILANVVAEFEWNQDGIECITSIKLLDTQYNEFNKDLYEEKQTLAIKKANEFYENYCSREYDY